MILIIFISLSLFLTFLTIYFGQYIKNGVILYWSIPLYILLYIVVVLVLFFTFVEIVNLLMKPNVNKKPNQLHSNLTKLISQLVLTITNCKVIVFNKELMPKNETFLMIGNHQSNIDPMSFMWAFKDINCTFIMKKSLMNLPIIGKWLYGAGFLPIDRDNDRKALETIVIAAKRIKNNENSIGVYPEGTRSKGPIINSFHSGTFKIAQKAECSVVLVANDNAYKMKYFSPFKRTKIYLEVVEVIPSEKVISMSTNELAKYSKERIEETLKKRREEIYWLKVEEKYTKHQKRCK